MILIEAMRCIAVALGLAAPEETPYVHVVSLSALKALYCNANCRGMYIPLRARYNGGRYTIVISPEAGADTLIHELTHHVQHLNGAFVAEAGPAGQAESQAKFMESEWSRRCPSVGEPLTAMIDAGGTPLPAKILNGAGASYAGSLGAQELRQRESLPAGQMDGAQDAARRRGWAVAD